MANGVLVFGEATEDGQLNPVTAELVKVHGPALQGNLEGNAVDRDTIVFLPPSYAKEQSRRYPVVYALHGYSIGAEQWSKEILVPRRSKVLSLRAPGR